ncbi:hypothetical protein BDK51DRAFT_19079, partial [Blyttiomyces helicus]
KTRFSSFPDVLVITLGRFVLGSNWVIEKINSKIHMPEEIDLDAYRGSGLQPGEVELPEDAPAAAAAPQVNADALAQLMGMGFPEIRCTKALLATGNNGADIAMNWLFEHMEDPDIDDPIPVQGAPGGGGASEADIAQLTDMGFSAAQARKALQETNNNMERAVDWLFSHADSMEEDTPAPSGASAAVAEPADTKPARYKLVSFISHKGTSTHAGHYVAHVRTADGSWVLFNDNKVVKVPAIAGPLAEGYMYLYERV